MEYGYNLLYAPTIEVLQNTAIKHIKQLRFRHSTIDLCDSKTITLKNIGKYELNTTSN